MHAEVWTVYVMIGLYTKTIVETHDVEDVMWNVEYWKHRDHVIAVNIKMKVNKSEIVINCNVCIK